MKMKSKKSKVKKTARRKAARPNDALAKKHVEAELQIGLSYATRLATHIWQNHWKDVAPNWQPLHDLVGVMTQIDNMTSGMIRRVGQTCTLCGGILVGVRPKNQSDPARRVCPDCLVHRLDQIKGLSEIPQ